MEDDVNIPKEVRLRYIERRQKDIETLRAALRTQALDEFERIGHQLKGNASSFGYSDLEKVAIQMELAGEKRDVAEASHQLALFEKWFEKASVESSSEQE
jgi:HPt (histidine-containing phosphotransfer) domain-containing protein